MIARSRIARSVVALTIFWGTVSSAVAQDEAVKPSIARLLGAGWGTKPEARRIADETYQQFVEQQPGNVPVLYAYALVKMQQRQYPEAVKLLDEYLRFKKSDPAALRAKIWLSMLLKNPTTALVELDKLSQALASDMAQELTEPAEIQARDNRQREYILFMGRMIGFLDGPGDSSVNAATLAAAKQKILTRLGETERTIYEEARSGIVDEYEVLAAAKDDAQAREIAVKEKAKRDTVETLNKEAEHIAVRKDQLSENADKIRKEAQADTDAYNRADAPLVLEITRLTSQANLFQRELFNLTTDLYSLRVQADRERDPVTRDILLREIGRREGIAFRLETDLSTVQNRIAGVQSQRATLAAQYQASQGTMAASLQRAQREYKSMDNRLKRAGAERDELKKPATGNTGKVISLNKQALALTTYDTFPLEQERQRLLAELK